MAIKGDHKAVCNLCNQMITIISFEAAQAIEKELLLIVCTDCLDILYKLKVGIHKLN